eukprot:1162096-Pelagomonas_calceolata.AAC.1
MRGEAASDTELALGRPHNQAHFPDVRTHTPVNRGWDAHDNRTLQMCQVRMRCATHAPVEYGGRGGADHAHAAVVTELRVEWGCDHQWVLLVIWDQRQGCQRGRGHEFLTHSLRRGTGGAAGRRAGEGGGATGKAHGFNTEMRGLNTEIKGCNTEQGTRVPYRNQGFKHTPRRVRQGKAQWLET